MRGMPSVGRCRGGSVDIFRRSPVPACRIRRSAPATAFRPCFRQASLAQLRWRASRFLLSFSRLSARFSRSDRTGSETPCDTLRGAVECGWGENEESATVSDRLGMLLSGLWLRVFLVQGRCGRKDPRKLSASPKRAWRILEVRRTVRMSDMGSRGREGGVPFGA